MPREQVLQREVNREVFERKERRRAQGFKTRLRKDALTSHYERRAARLLEKEALNAYLPALYSEFSDGSLPETRRPDSDS